MSLKNLKLINWFIIKNGLKPDDVGFYSLGKGDLDRLLKEYETEQLSLANVVGQSEQLTCPMCKSTNILNPDKDNDAQCIECAFIWAG